MKPAVRALHTEAVHAGGAVIATVVVRIGAYRRVGRIGVRAGIANTGHSATVIADAVVVVVRIVASARVVRVTAVVVAQAVAVGIHTVVEGVVVRERAQVIGAR